MLIDVVQRRKGVQFTQAQSPFVKSYLLPRLPQIAPYGRHSSRGHTTNTMWLTKTKDEWSMTYTNAFMSETKKQSQQGNVTRDPAFLEPQPVRICR
jgi:hypothetical protein